MAFKPPISGLLLITLVILHPSLAETAPKSRMTLFYRTVNWCVTGRDEPELHMFPYSQFVPILRRTDRFTQDNPAVRYHLDFYEILTSQRDLGQNGTLFKTVHVTFRAEIRQDRHLNTVERWDPLPLEGLIIQANHNPGTIGLPTGQFFPIKGDEVTCLDCDTRFWSRSIPCRKRVNFAMEHPTVLVFHHLMPPFNGTTNLLDEKVLASQGKQDEIHSNFRWYSPPCAETRRLQFTILAVRSFQLHQYDIVNKGPYEVRIRGQHYQSDYFPSPYFYYWSQRANCHLHSAVDIQTEHSKKFRPFEMSSKFGCCTRFEENPKQQRTLEAIPEKFSLSCKNISGRNRIPLKIEKGDESVMCFFPSPVKPCSWEIERADLDYPGCSPCVRPNATTTQKATEKPTSIYKRTFHGGIMIMTNFCLQPIVIFIARFYKETFNLHSFKGVKLWYWLHLAGGMISSTMIYFGYFSGAVTRDKGYSHVVFGNVYILTLLFCYLTSWGRHKNKIINLCAEFIHGSLGYVTISLALMCVETAPELGMIPKTLVYSMIATQILFMIIMTSHICVLDSKFGMRPRRRHLPTVEARFDEVPVPRAKFRIILLVVFSCITFGLSFSSTFFE